ncbi:MAG: 1-deoxy-D-xylulose-5-phosphate reductoisomerase [Chthoniobacterales bacterium]|nr:1-deoxy-D-xylulose-5-phosphate reductoisomerase [Chthoniobacterales bacterium]
MNPRKVSLLGATGSIGSSAAEVARTIPDRMKIVGLSGNKNGERLLEMTREFHPDTISTQDATTAEQLQQELGTHCKIHHGPEGLIKLATMPEADLVLIAISGTAGLQPALAALEAGKDLAVASKEILVMAGKQVMTTAKKHHLNVLPVDSEHSALFQCLEGRDPTTVRRLILTCSGGPFRNVEKGDSLFDVTPEMALRHPTWKMGKKITLDSATLFNKGLEMIEAQYLFNIPMEKIDVVIHPESIIHSMVEFVDGSILAQLSQNNMMLPIQYAVTYPHRVAGPASYLDLASIGRLHFENPRHDLFPALRLARQAGMQGGTMPAVLNAANEVAVALFLEGKIPFPEIWHSVERAMNTIPLVADPSLDEILIADQEARSLLVD